MTKKHQEEKPEPKKTHPTSRKATAPVKALNHEKTHISEKTHDRKKTSVPKKPPVPARKAPSGDTSIPSMTEEQTQAYMKFSEACKEVYEKFSTEKIDTRLIQLKSSSALIAVVRFMVMMHDLLKMYGVMQFNKNVSPELYKYLDEIQEQTGQKFPLARVLLDGIKTTKMELLSGVTVHPLSDFEEPEYKTMKAKIPDPVDPADEEFEQQDQTEQQDQSDLAADPLQNVGPGGPYMDPTIQPQPGTAVDPPVNPPASVEEEQPLEQEPPLEEQPMGEEELSEEPEQQ